MSEEPLLQVRELSIGFPADGQVIQAADRVGFEVFRGRTLGLVGESGCGKSVTLRSLLGLVPEPGRVLEGEASFAGRDLLALRGAELTELRGSQISMIFQDPSSALNPVVSIGKQIAEVLRGKRGLGRGAAPREAITLLDRVGIPAARERIHDYPHQLSGGMRQRVMIALAIAAGPQLLLADEPTTALDVTIQDQILGLLANLQAETGMAMILVSHDLGVVAQACDQVAVMYAGRVVEFGSVKDVLQGPRHPYTEALLEALPVVTEGGDRVRLQAIGGQPPELDDLPPGCSFTPRCPYAKPECSVFSMALDRTPPEHGAACVLAHRGAR